MGLFDKKKKEVAVIQPKEVVTGDTVKDWMKTFGHGTKLLDHELEAFVQMATEFQLNPFKREIYCIAYGQGNNRTLSIITGYEVYISKAQESGLLEDWSIEEAPPGTSIDKYWATLTVKRKDFASEQKWSAYWEECHQTSPIWKKQPKMMTKKVAMSQGFRLFFEDVYHGIPYTREEMPEDKGGLKDVTPESAIKAVSDKPHIEPEGNRMPQMDASTKPAVVEPQVDVKPSIGEYVASYADVIQAVNSCSDGTKKISIMKRAALIKKGESEESYSVLLEEING